METPYRNSTEIIKAEAELHTLMERQFELFSGTMFDNAAKHMAKIGDQIIANPPGYGAVLMTPDQVRDLTKLIVKAGLIHVAQILQSMRAEREAREQP